MKRLLLLIFLFSFSFIQAQFKRDYRWYFDGNKGMHFMSGAPQQISGAIVNAIEGSTSMCDSITGALLFYLDEQRIYTKNGTAMPNGSLSTSISPTQFMALPAPGNKNKYYVFFTGGNYGAGVITYVVVDMSLNGGNGAVLPGTSGNMNTIVTPNFVSEGLTAVKHANGYDWWVVYHDFKATFPNVDSTYYVSLLDGSGVKLVNTQKIGNRPRNFTGSMCSAPDGSKIGAVDIGGLLNIIDFDRCTGTLSNCQYLSKQYDYDVSTGKHSNSFYGCSFSPNSKLFYTAEYLLNTTIYQYDATAANVGASVKKVVSTGTAGFNGMQLGPDGKLYMSKSNSRIQVINNPDNVGSVNITQVNFWSSVNAFPYYPNYNLGPKPNTAKANNDTIVCKGANITLSVNTADSYSWSPASGLSCTNCQNPIATPTVTTTYTVIITGGCGSGIAKDSVTVTVTNSPVTTLTNDTSTCTGNNLQLQASGGSAYNWTPASGLSCTNCPNPVTSTTVTTTYFVNITSSCGVVKDSVKITLLPPPIANAGKDTTICAGETAQLSGNGGSVYSWTPSTGLSCTTCANPIASPSTTTTYTFLTTQGNCKAVTDAVTITVNTPAALTATGDTTIQTGGQAVIAANGPATASYSWSPASSLSSPTATTPVASPQQTTQYIVTMTDQLGCVVTDTVLVVVEAPPCMKTIAVPTAFSPNGDGVNDIFRIRADKSCVKELTFIVYSRWGEKLFETNDLTIGWDGTHRGKLLDAGVFVFYIKLTTAEDSEISYKGNVTLVR